MRSQSHPVSAAIPTRRKVVVFGYPCLMCATIWSCSSGVYFDLFGGLAISHAPHLEHAPERDRWEVASRAALGLATDKAEVAATVEKRSSCLDLEPALC